MSSVCTSTATSWLVNNVKGPLVRCVCIICDFKAGKACRAASKTCMAHLQYVFRFNWGTVFQMSAALWKKNWEKHLWEVRWKHEVKEQELSREGVKLLSVAWAQVQPASPPGCDSLHAGKTFNSLEMEAHYPQQPLKDSIPPSRSPHVCLVWPRKTLYWSHMTPSAHWWTDWPQKQGVWLGSFWL